MSCVLSLTCFQLTHIRTHTQTHHTNTPEMGVLNVRTRVHVHTCPHTSPWFFLLMVLVLWNVIHHTYTCTLTCTTYVHTHCVHTHMHTYAHIHLQSHAHTHAHEHTRTHTHTRTQTHSTHTHAHTHTHMHTHMHTHNTHTHNTHTCTHTCTHIHTHTRLEEIIPKISPIIPFFYSQRIFLLFFEEEKLFPRMLPIILKQINVNAGWWTCKNNNTNTQGGLVFTFRFLAYTEGSRYLSLSSREGLESVE